MSSATTYALELRFAKTGPAQLEVLQSLLASLRIPQTHCVAAQDGTLLKLQVFLPDRSACLKLQKRLQSLSLKGCAYRIAVFRQSEWQDAWKKGLKPFCLTPRVRVFPYGLARIPKRYNAQALVLETGLAFGSGLHATTRMMARLIASKEDKFESFLDVGIGTGILALAAQRHGAQSITGVDVSEDALAMTRRNCELNGVAPFELRRTGVEALEAGRRYDFVSANLHTDILLAGRDRLIACVNPGKYLAVSGIAVEHLPELRRGFETKRLRCLRLLREKGWAALLYRVR